MSDAISTDVIDSLADKLASFADTLSAEERSALDRFFLQPVDGDDVSGYGMELDAVRAAQQAERDRQQAQHDDPASRRHRYAATLRKVVADDEA
jgi:hypothetical protein